MGDRGAQGRNGSAAAASPRLRHKRGAVGKWFIQPLRQPPTQEAPRPRARQSDR